MFGLVFVFLKILIEINVRVGKGGCGKKKNMLTANSVICFTALLLHDATSATKKLVLLQNVPISVQFWEK